MEAYALTDIGQIRSMNQDYIYSSPEMVGSLPNLFLVADGMGGHKAGDYASRFAVENLVIYINRAGKGSPVMQLKMGIEEVNERLYEESLKREELKGMGCTLVAGVVEDGTLYVANVGDSRLYLIQAGAIQQVTRDHSYVEELVAMGKLKRGSRDYMEKKNIITRAVGVSEEVDTDLFALKLKSRDQILMCSDGLSNMVDEFEMEYIIRSEDGVEARAKALVDAANRSGGQDNISVLLIEPQISEVSL